MKKMHVSVVDSDSGAASGDDVSVIEHVSTTIPGRPGHPPPSSLRFPVDFVGRRTRSQLGSFHL